MSEKGAMRRVPAGEFKAKCLALMDEVQSRGEGIVITKRGKPVVRMMPLEEAAETPKPSIFGFMRGMATITGDIVESAFSDEEWERMTDEKFAPSSFEREG
jgi:prevent-host-death family protein